MTMDAITANTNSTTEIRNLRHLTPWEAKTLNEGNNTTMAATAIGTIKAKAIPKITVGRKYARDRHRLQIMTTLSDIFKDEMVVLSLIDTVSSRKSAWELLVGLLNAWTSNGDEGGKIGKMIIMLHEIMMGLTITNASLIIPNANESVTKTLQITL